MIRITFVAIIMCCIMIATSCKKPNDTIVEKCDTETHRETKSVYYWKTVFQLDSTELDFIKNHDIGRIYLRMFDVVNDNYAVSPEDEAYPTATVRIDNDQYYLLGNILNTIEIVPVVYITLDALRAMRGNEDVLAKNIVTRVRNMAEYNGLPNVEEFQLDCDWTESTKGAYFTLCKAVRSNLNKLDLAWKLSSTIRFHQLSGDVPPVDRGVLMVYNTGSFNDPDTRNSIIDINDIKPYLKRLPSYPLHLDIAYPTYSWQLLFRKRKFIGLTNGLEIRDISKFSHNGPGLYVAKQDIPHHGKIIKSGDMVRSEISEYAEIKAVKDRIDKLLSDKPHSNIIYHLDIKNLSNYSHDEIRNILSVND